MKAIVYTRYGPPDVFHLQEVEKPTPKDDEVLIRIRATVVTASENAGRTGRPLFVRVFTGFRGPRKPILGTELAGEIESIGRNVKRFKEGDQVVAATGVGVGCYAEYRCLPEEGALALKPTNLTYEEAVGVIEGGLTSLPFLRDHGKIQTGQEVLINGASGALGTYAVQLAKYFGAAVTGVCSTANGIW